MRAAGIALIVAAAATISSAALGQGPSRNPGPQAGRIIGMVGDASGVGIPGVVATVIPETGGDARTVISGANGRYAFEDMPDGTYRIDWDIAGFDTTRRNHVQVVSGETANADGTLYVTTLCECISTGALDALRPRMTAHNGQVVDGSGRPLPHARLEIVGPAGPEAIYANREGQFQIRLSPDQTWPLTARDSGFSPVTFKVSGGTPEGALVFQLPNAETRNLPVMERLRRPCCPRDLFANLGA